MAEIDKPHHSAASTDIERLKLAVDVWKHVVSVQMHFNDVEMKVRNLYFTILAAAIGAIGFVQGRKIAIPYLDLKISLALTVLAAVVPMSLLFYFIDRHWYHRLLQGAVEQAGEIEKRYADQIPEIGLGAKISNASPVTFEVAQWRRLLFFVTDKKFRTHVKAHKGIKLHSDAKIEILYKSVMWGAGSIAIGYGLVEGIQLGQQPIMYWTIKALTGLVHLIL